jgi:hypothetical protein
LWLEVLDDSPHISTYKSYILSYSFFFLFVLFCLKCSVTMNGLGSLASNCNRKILYNIFNIIFDWNNRQNKAYRGRRWEWKGTETNKKRVSFKGNWNICAEDQPKEVKTSTLNFWIHCKTLSYNSKQSTPFQYTTRLKIIITM